MDVQPVAHEHPCRAGITRDGTLYVLHNSLCRPGGPYRRRHHVPRRDLNRRHQRLGAMPTIVKFYALDHTGLHWSCGRCAGVGLKAGLLVGAHEMPTLFRPWGGLWIPRPEGGDLGVTWRGIFGAVVMEPSA